MCPRVVNGRVYVRVKILPTLLSWNPVKYGWVKNVSDWPYYSFHAYVRKSVYPINWACGVEWETDVGEWRDRCGSCITASYGTNDLGIYEMKIVAVMLMRNEADIIESWVRYYAREVDHNK